MEYEGFLLVPVDNSFLSIYFLRYCSENGPTSDVTLRKLNLFNEPSFVEREYLSLLPHGALLRIPRRKKYEVSPQSRLPVNTGLLFANPGPRR